MEFIPQAVPDVLLIKPKVFGDDRGYFVETFRQDKFEQAVGHKVTFVQDNESKSTKGVFKRSALSIASVCSKQIGASD
jgi:dTDP-4-dehydrorhamnose 3,5-epimerase